MARVAPITSTTRSCRSYWPRDVRSHQPRRPLLASACPCCCRDASRRTCQSAGRPSAGACSLPRSYSLSLVRRNCLTEQEQLKSWMRSVRACSLARIPNAAWGKLAVEFIIAKRSPDTLKPFINTVLGEAWRDESEGLDDADLMGRVEPIPALILLRSSAMPLVKSHWMLTRPQSRR